MSIAVEKDNAVVEKRRREKWKSLSYKGGGFCYGSVFFRNFCDKIYVIKGGGV